MVDRLISWEALSAKDYDKVPFLLDPYIPREGIVLLHGDTSIGKSPLTWEMAKAMASGKSFFGLPTQASTVLYIEVDSPEITLAPRLKLTKPAPKGVWFLIGQSMSVPNITKEQLDTLREAEEEIKPDVVFLNTLRKLHDLDDKESRTPKIVYSFFQQIFPKSALIFIHHDRKSPTDPRMIENSKESFSGSKHWLDDAQVGIHLARYNTRDARHNLMLWHTKSQVSGTLKPFPLKLHKDGTHLTSPLYDELLQIYELLNEKPDAPKGEIDVEVAQGLGISVTTAKRRRLLIEAGKFPGTRDFWMPDEEANDDP